MILYNTQKVQDTHHVSFPAFPINMMQVLKQLHTGMITGHAIIAKMPQKWLLWYFL